MANGWRGRGPLYRVLLKDSDCFPTCVVAGPDRRRAWLYVHATTPTVLRLHPPVVEFLLTTLAEWDGADAMVRSLPADSSVSYPGCVAVGRDGKAWLYVMSATPSVVPLFPRLVSFLRDVLAELPTVPDSSRPTPPLGSPELEQRRAEIGVRVAG